MIFQNLPTLKLTLCAVKVCGFWQMTNVICPSLSYHREEIDHPDKCLVFTYSTIFHPALHSTSDLLDVSLVLRFQECYKSGMFGVFRWLLSLSYMHLRLIHVFLWLDSSFPMLLNHIPLYGCSTALFIHSPIKEHIGWFMFGATLL